MSISFQSDMPRSASLIYVLFFEINQCISALVHQYTNTLQVFLHFYIISWGVGIPRLGSGCTITDPECPSSIGSVLSGFQFYSFKKILAALQTHIFRIQRQCSVNHAPLNHEKFTGVRRPSSPYPQFRITTHFVKS